jgi:ribonuclease VapC
MVLDAHALMVYLEKEEGYEKLEKIFLSSIEKNEELLMTSVNFGEIYYIVMREIGKEKAREIENVIDSLPIKIINVDKELAKTAANFKAFKKISYADSFAVALAKQTGKSLITGDKEFKSIEKEIKVLWI